MLEQAPTVHNQMDLLYTVHQTCHDGRPTDGFSVKTAISDTLVPARPFNYVKAYTASESGRFAVKRDAVLHLTKKRMPSVLNAEQQRPYKPLVLGRRGGFCLSWGCQELTDPRDWLALGRLLQGTIDGSWGQFIIFSVVQTTAGASFR